MYLIVNRTVGKMSLELFHKTITELEKKATWFSCEVMVLDKETVQVTIEWR